MKRSVTARNEVPAAGAPRTVTEATYQRLRQDIIWGRLPPDTPLRSDELRAAYAVGISPLREAGKVSRERYGRLATAAREILARAIQRGGTTLRDFISPDGAPGYFEQELLVYGREDEPCRECGKPLRHATIGQRATVWCPRCQR